MKYRAFFSYSRADERVAKWLHAQLDRYRTPKPLVGMAGTLGPVPAKLHPIFKDRSDLNAGGALSAALQQALQDSETLVVLCTPASARSTWVDEECQRFIALDRAARIYPVIAAGEPDSGDAATECFPPALRGRGLLAADLRELRQPGGRVIGDGRDGARLKLIAGLLGLPLDALVQRERRRQRRLLVALGMAALVFAVLTVVAGLAATLASRRLEASQRAESRELVERVEERLDAGDPLTAMELALNALPDAGDRPLLAEAASALQAARAEDRLRLVRRRDGLGVLGLAIAPDDRSLDVLWSDGVLEKVDVATGLVETYKRFTAPQCASPPVLLGLASATQHVLALCPDTEPGAAPAQRGSLLLWQAASPGEPRSVPAPPHLTRPLPLGERWSVSVAGSRALLQAPPTAGAALQPVLVDFGPRPQVREIASAGVVQAVMFAGGDLLATVSERQDGRGTACLWDARTGARRACTPSDLDIRAVAAEPAARRVALMDSTQVAWWQADNGRIGAALAAGTADLDLAQVRVAGGTLFGVKTDERSIVVARPLGEGPGESWSLPTAAAGLASLTLSNSRRLVAAAANGAAVAVWSAQPSASRRFDLPQGTGDVLAVTVEDGRVRTVLRAGHGLQRWPEANNIPVAEVDDAAVAVIHGPAGPRRIDTGFPRRFIEAVRAAAAARGAEPPAAGQLQVPRLRHAEVSRDGRRVLFVAERTGACEVWDVDQGTLLYSSLPEAAAAWRGNAVSQGAVYWSCWLNADGTRIVRSGNVGVDLRDTASGAVLWSDPRDLRLAISGDGKRLGAFATSRGAWLLDTASGAVLAANADLPGLQIHGVGGPDSAAAIDLANGRMRLVRIADGVELARSAGHYRPAPYGPWVSADGRWFVTRGPDGLELFDLQVPALETQVDAARARAFAAGALGRRNVISADSRHVPRPDARSSLHCDALLLDPFDPARKAAALIFPAFDGSGGSLGRELGCAHPRERPAAAAALYAWALGWLAIESDRGPLDGEIGSLAAYVINPPTRDFDADVAAALEEAARGGHPVAWLRRAQMLAWQHEDPRRWDDAIAMARRAEAQGVPAAAWWLSEVHRLRGETSEAESWLVRAEAQRFPHAYARRAEAAEREALENRGDGMKAAAATLRAIAYWTRAIESARALAWPRDYADHLRTRRATLARSGVAAEAALARVWRDAVDEQVGGWRQAWRGR